MAEPPSLAGAVQVRLIWVPPLAAATRAVGEPGPRVTVCPVPSNDHSPSPSALVARTCTSWKVPGCKLPMAALVPITSCGPAVKGPLLPWRYCRS